MAPLKFRILNKGKGNERTSLGPRSPYSKLLFKACFSVQLSASHRTRNWEKLKPSSGRKTTWSLHALPGQSKRQMFLKIGMVTGIEYSNEMQKFHRNRFGIPTVALRQIYIILFFFAHSSRRVGVIHPILRKEEQH